MNNNFSAFKLFYDEFIYKQNGFVSYSKIDRNISNIRDLTIELRKTPKYDINYYTTKLNRINKRIKEQLDAIYDLNKSVFEYYLLLYKSRVDVCNDLAKDMPFVISCSFYDDYRLDNKSPIELESNPYVVPKYSSYEKKEIRSISKDLSRFEYFIKLLNDSKNCNLYEKFLLKTKYIMNIKPFFNESHFDYFKRLEVYINEIEHLYSRLEEKAKTCEDYENISELMFIAYKKKFIDWNIEIKNIIIDYYDQLYKNTQSDNEIKKNFNVGNSLSYESFLEYCSNIDDEKKYYLQLFKNGEGLFNYIDDVSEAETDKLKEVLIKSYFDKKYFNTITDNSDVEDYVLRTIDLYLLAEEIGVKVFEKILFDASHSKDLKRNNDVNSAIISKIYNTYNPFESYTYYERARVEFEEKLALQNDEFMRKYTPLLIQKKREYDYHGPIPLVNVIKTNVIEYQKKFIIENCTDNLVSFDISKQYDTRNYDLSVVAYGLSLNDFIELYGKMKDMINHSTWKDENNKKLILYSAQNFILNELYKVLKLSDTSLEERKNKYNAICREYLKEELISENNNIEEIDKNIVRFERSKEKFIKNSKWKRVIEDSLVIR